MTTRGIVVGLDGTAESAAAAEWAAQEALLRGTVMRLVHVMEPRPEDILHEGAPVTREKWAEDLLTRSATALRARHAGLPVTTRLMPPSPVQGLVAAGSEADLLVLGSRALGRVAGSVIGSVGLSVVGRVVQPVVLVRAAGDATTHGQVLVGLDVRQPCDSVLAFAFDAAARRQAAVNAVYTQQIPLYATLGPTVVPDMRLSVAAEIGHWLSEMMEPWQTKYPDVDATCHVVAGSAGQELVRASADADLVVVGRRTPRSPLGAHIGHVAHAVLHHSPAPVALVPHD
ncbi:universal stress protein [Streptomyces sp. NPDC056527]|uniref:universal stress protein n=1 Tax=Streptomyces sp. NPDC056527 TaxID=3345853 RepID=UPI003677D71A